MGKRKPDFSHVQRGVCASTLQNEIAAAWKNDSFEENQVRVLI
jgi:hypothetical protein